jgi:hypothetical protein
MKLLVASFTILAVAGCAAPSEPAKPATPPIAAKKGPTPPVGGAGIAPMGTPAVGGLTPVANSDSVEGAGGGGVSQAAKMQARRAAAGAGNGESNSTATTTGE